MRTCVRSGCKAPLVLNLNSRKMWTIIFGLRATHFQDKNPPVHISWDVGWAPDSVWTWWRRKNPTTCRESNTGRPVRIQSLYWLQLFWLSAVWRRDTYELRKWFEISALLRYTRDFSLIFHVEYCNEKRSIRSRVIWHLWQSNRVLVCNSPKSRAFLVSSQAYTQGDYKWCELFMCSLTSFIKVSLCFN
jgi:hypothetical protein